METMTRYFRMVNPEWIIAILLCLLISSIALMLKWRHRAKMRDTRIFGTVNMGIGEFGIEARLIPDCTLGEILKHSHVTFRVSATKELDEYLRITKAVDRPEDYS